MQSTFDLIVFLTLLALGYAIGTWQEKRHFASIRKREQNPEYQALLAFSERTPPPRLEPVTLQLVGGNVVISVDYFKRFAAGLRSLIGGRVTTYEPLLERARREALLRMKAEAHRLGADMIINVKLETASITKGKKQQVGCVEVYAYGTALIPAKTPTAS